MAKCAWYGSSARPSWEKEYYGIYFGVKTLEDLLDNRHFILKTDHMNLTYLNVTLQDKDFHLCHVPGKEVHQFVPVALSRLCDNHMPAKESEKPAPLRYTTPWLATGASRNARSVSMILRSPITLSPSSYANAHAVKS
jgi:hypothetical protein